MQQYKYLIIGGGIAADSAVQGIREIDQQGSIGILTSEKYPPYNRPPLTKALWKNEPEDILWRKTDRHNVDLHLSTMATGISVKNKTVTGERGEQYLYEKLLLATGGKVNKLTGDTDGIIYYRNFEDYKKLRKLTSDKNNFVVIGGGFIGSEIAAALAMNGKQVTLAFPGKGIGSGIFPDSLSGFLNEYFFKKRVNILSQDPVNHVEQSGDGFNVTTRMGAVIKTDVVVAGIGIKPDVALAESAGLRIDNGITVNELLQTSDPDIYAAGDVANFFSPYLDSHYRFEHEDNANAMGMAAGRNMAGAGKPYHYLPFFYSDLFDLGYEAVGDLNSSYNVVEQWKDKYREGVLYYLHHGKVKGVLLWNTWGQVEHARKLIADSSTFDKKTVLNRLPV
jgi:3-phenylpropionate/trans-cinnamate dioxygenase ferredoxin reductase component